MLKGVLELPSVASITSGSPIGLVPFDTVTSGSLSPLAVPVKRGLAQGQRK